MKIVLVLLLVASSLTAQEATFTDITVTGIVDGDTWDVKVSLPVGITFDVRLRPLGLDCAEPRGDTRAEGERQTEALEALLFSATSHQLEVHGKDAFGRWLVHVWADSIDVVEYMRTQGCEGWP